MGVTGLWRLVEPSGKPVPLETLENKVLAVDVSIWLHQAIKGFQDSQGAPLPNAHLLGIYHRVCKLLYFRIKPVFVFDGGVPNLKKETICKRNQQKSKKLSEAERIQKQLLTTLLKHSAVNKVLSETTKATLTTKPNLSKLANKQPAEDIYKLPPTDFDSTLSDDDETSESVDSSPTKHWDLHTIDEKSPHFRALPADVRHDILTDLKETRKQSSWGKIHEMPKQSDDFSSFQMKRLLKRYSVQVSLEEAEKEMGGRSLSLAELEMLLKDQGVDTSSNSLGSRIASDENTRYLLIKDVKKAMDEASKRESPVLESIQEKDEEEPKLAEISNGETETVENQSNNPDSEFQRDLEKAIQLSLQDVPSTSKDTTKSETASKSKKLNFSFLEDFDDADFQSSSESEDDSRNQKNIGKILASAKSYMVEYSGLTPSEIAKIIGGSTNSLGKNKINGSSENVNSRISPENNEVESSTSLNVNKEVKRAETLHDDGEDGTVSSSTTNVVKVTNKVTVNAVDANEVTSSTSKFNEVLTNKCDNKTIEIMSDTDSSSDEFLEVSETNPKASEFEILIKPEDSIEDDIFSDIFCDKPDSISTNTNNDFIKPHAQQEFVEQVSSSAPDEPTKSNSEFNDSKSTVTASAIPSDNLTNCVGRELIENTKEEREKTVLEEFIKPKQIEEVTGTTDDSVAQKGNEKQVLTTEQLLEIEANLQQEEAELISERSSKERMANNLTEQIYQEAQELLQLFGLPYIVAPMEAEAQCAFLNDIDLTDGTITDDSDIWLFGGRTVYKNFFNQHKLVMEFRAENILHHFKLSREQMILLALLVGSDYTVGIQGIGPVTALEVLAAFPPSKNTDQQLTSGLNEFRKWLVGERAPGPGRTTLRNKLKNVALTESFPSLQVVKAYLEPTVDSSREPFTWGKPDMIGLMEFARRKFGWTRVKSEEILKPVLKRLNETHIQRSIKDYFKTKHKIDGGEIESAMSKRVKKAINRIEKGDVDSDEDKSKKIRKKRQHKGKTVTETTKKDVSSAVADEAINNEIAGLSSDEDIQILKKTRTESKKKLQQIETEVKSEIEQQAKKQRPTVNLHKKTVIPQKEKDKIDALRTKMKAIEVYRKSKKGPGYVQKRTRVARQAKEDAGLSESSSSD